MSEVLIALGSNVGDRLANLQKAVDLLRAEIELKQASHVYETEPMYVEDQPPFLNAAVLGETLLEPMTLLKKLKEIEREVGRLSRIVNGPREVDLDLISYGDVQCDAEALRIPHPRLAERRFVLAPLADIAPDRVIPGAGKVSALLAQTNDQAGSVLRINDAVLHL